MEMSRSTPTRSIAILAVLVTAACGSGGDGDPTTPTNESIGIALSAPTLSVVQGQNNTVAVTLTRNGGYAGAVSLALENAPTGVTGAFSPASLSGTTVSSTLTINAAAGAAASTSSLVIRATGTGVSAQTAPLALTVTAAPTGGFTLAVSSATLSLLQGTSGAVTVNVNRTAPFSGAVSVAPVSLPTNITMTPNPASITGANTQVTFNVAASVPAGSYPIVLRGTGTGAPDQQVTVTLQVSAPSTGGTSVTITFCQADAPIWVASQSESGPWIRASTSATNTYTFNIANRGGFAAVYNASGGGYRVEFTYGTASELATTGPQCIDPTGSKFVSGTVTSLTNADEAYISLGGSETTRMGAGAFQLFDVGDGPLDLIAVRSATTTSSTTPNKMILRRDVNQANNSVIPALDFAAAEAFDPIAATITIGNLGSDIPFLLALLTTRSGGTGVYYFGGLFGGGAVQPWYGVPESRLTTGDLHNLIALGVNEAGTQYRAVYLWARAVANKTVTIGPAIPAPTFSVVSTNPYVRHRVQFARQPEYSQAALVQLDQNSETGGANYRLTSIQATSAYLGTATSWDLTVPDLSSATGFLSTWGLQPSIPTGYSVGAIGGTGDINAYPVDGLTLTIGFRLGSTASSEANLSIRDAEASMRRLARSWLRRPR
jgi:hypothetical protein